MRLGRQKLGRVGAVLGRVVSPEQVLSDLAESFAWSSAEQGRMLGRTHTREIRLRTGSASGQITAGARALAPCGVEHAEVRKHAWNDRSDLCNVCLPPEVFDGVEAPAWYKEPPRAPPRVPNLRRFRVLPGLKLTDIGGSSTCSRHCVENA